MTYISVLGALADGTRRRLLDQLRRRPLAVGELAVALRVTQPAVSQHLRVLEHANLVSFTKHGRRRIYTVSNKGLGELRGYLETLWSDVLTAFADGDPNPPSAQEAT